MDKGVRVVAKVWLTLMIVISGSVLVGLATAMMTMPSEIAIFAGVTLSLVVFSFGGLSLHKIWKGQIDDLIDEMHDKFDRSNRS